MCLDWKMAIGWESCRGISANWLVWMNVVIGPTWTSSNWALALHYFAVLSHSVLHTVLFKKCGAIASPAKITGITIIIKKIPFSMAFGNGRLFKMLTINLIASQPYTTFEADDCWRSHCKWQSVYACFGGRGRFIEHIELFQWIKFVRFGKKKKVRV